MKINFQADTYTCTCTTLNNAHMHVPWQEQQWSVSVGASSVDLFQEPFL